MTVKNTVHIHCVFDFYIQLELVGESKKETVE